jgi:hypothetical protein
MGFKIQKAKSIQEGEYNAVLSDVEQAAGQFGPCLKFFFRVVDGEYADTEVSMIRPAKLVPGNKLDKTLQSMGIDTLSIEDEIDVDTLKGKLVKVTVVNKVTDRGKVFANVEEVKAVGGMHKATTPAPTPKPAVKTSVTSVTSANIEDVPF